MISSIELAPAICILGDKRKISTVSLDDSHTCTPRVIRWQPTHVRSNSASRLFMTCRTPLSPAIDMPYTHNLPTRTALAPRAKAWWGSVCQGYLQRGGGQITKERECRTHLVHIGSPPDPRVKQYDTLVTDSLDNLIEYFKKVRA